ncbi:MAG: metallophosphoesterase [Cyanothece sp. SIO1E1]|nr:metallophosphoesterase [Cyanothece sp. SIO1E1]
MKLNFRFAIISDLHIALPHTIWDHPTRFHLVEVSIPVFEQVLERLHGLDLDFLLMPGDLTQHGEAENHTWLAQQLAQLPFPVYVVPGNHDIPEQFPNSPRVGLTDFPRHYQAFGYEDGARPYYSCEVVPGVRLIGLNSNYFDQAGQQIGLGRLDTEQLLWLKDVLATATDELVMVMVHHNVVEHLPNQLHHPLGRRYMMENAADLLAVLQAAEVQLIFTGHLHVQDIAQHQGIYEITTGSLVSYPHPYRILNFRTNDQGQRWLQIESMRVESVPGWPGLQEVSRHWMGDRSFPFMLKLLTQPPLNLPRTEAEALAPNLRYFWANVANGDALFDFPHFPPKVREYFKSFNATDPDGHLQLIDNWTTLRL